MTRVLIPISVAILIGAFSVWRFSRRSPGPSAARPDLRSLLLRRELLAQVGPSRGGIRAALMDWTVNSGTATLIAYDDDTTSLYYSNGGGVIGAGEHDAVRQASKAFRVEMERLWSQFRPVPAGDRCAFPPTDAVAFYLVTDTETLRTGPVGTSKIREASHPLHSAGDLAQAVITQIRLATK